MTLFSTVKDQNGNYVFTYTRTAQTPEGKDVEIIDRVDIRSILDIQTEIDASQNRLADAQRVIDEKTLMLDESARADIAGVDNAVLAPVVIAPAPAISPPIV